MEKGVDIGIKPLKHKNRNNFPFNTSKLHQRDSVDL